MSYPPTSLQLWSVRDLTKTDFAATVAQVAAIGYTGVETAGFGNLTATEGAAAIKAAGLHVSGMHVGIGALRHEFDRVVAEAQACTTRHIICPSWPKNQFATAASCTAVGQELGAIVKSLSTITAKEMANDIGVPLHPGSAKAYKEAGAL